MSYLRNKEPKPPVVHFMRPWKYATMTSCGQYAFERAAVASEPRGAQRTNILVASDVDEVTCGSCVRTREYKRTKERAMAPKHEATVGIPTQGSEDTMLERPINMGKVMTEAAKIGRPTAEPLAGALLGENETFGPHEPMIHAAAKRGNPSPLCLVSDPDDRSITVFDGYSTMDGGAVNCRACLQHPEFIRRNDEFTKMMSPSHPNDYVKPVGKQHDEVEPEAGEPLFSHDCPACVYLGHDKGFNHDLYFCQQSGGSGDNTVVARYGHQGPDYRSGIHNARDDAALALAVVRAFHMGLLSDEDMSWL